MRYVKVFYDHVKCNFYNVIVLTVITLLCNIITKLHCHAIRSTRLKVSSSVWFWFCESAKISRNVLSVKYASIHIQMSVVYISLFSLFPYLLLLRLLPPWLAYSASVVSINRLPAVRDQSTKGNWLVYRHSFIPGTPEISNCISTAHPVCSLLSSPPPTLLALSPLCCIILEHEGSRFPLARLFSVQFNGSPMIHGVVSLGRIVPDCEHIVRT